MNYKLEYLCKKCTHKGTVDLTKEQALYIQKRVGLDKCSKCKSSEFEILSTDSPELTEEILRDWARSDSLNFAEQDEDMLIANSDSFSTLLSLLAESETTDIKRGIIVQGLCCFLYDEIENDNSYEGRVKSLIENKDHMKLAKDQFIEPYIAEKVFPVLGFEIR